MSRTFEDLERAAFIEGRPEAIVLGEMLDQVAEVAALEEQVTTLEKRVEKMEEEAEEAEQAMEKLKDENFEALERVAVLEKQIHDSGLDLV